MAKQQTLAAVAWARKWNVTRRERCRAEMDALVPWGELLGLTKPDYPAARKGGRPL